MEPYVHEQRSSILLNSWLAKGVLVVAGTLKTRVDGTTVTWEFKYGIGWGEVAIADVRSVEIARGGFHSWSLAGYQTVAITKRNWRVVTIGTDEPEELIAAIERFRGA
jgi:hypothetical protein